jgi:hypothetical protein
MPQYSVTVKYTEKALYNTSSLASGYYIVDQLFTEENVTVYLTSDTHKRVAQKDNSYY